MAIGRSEPKATAATTRMPSPIKIFLRHTLSAISILLSLQLAIAQSTAAPPENTMPTITVQGPASATATQFLSGFISTAMRLNGPNLISCTATAVKARPDLADKIIVCALNIARINGRSFAGRLPVALINQLIKAAVAAAPTASSAIVKAAIASEPYARDSIIAAAVAAAPDQESEIQVAAANSSTMSMLAMTVTSNPSEAGPLGPVNSPEQPPSGP